MIDEYRNQIICIDARAGLKLLPDESVDCVVTSPPYWSLRDYQLEPLESDLLSLSQANLIKDKG